MTLERRTTVTPAYDMRPKSPGEPNYGIHNANIAFAIVGPKGAVELIVGTGWYLPHVHQELFESGHWAATHSDGRAMFRYPAIPRLIWHENAKFSDMEQAHKCGYTESGFCISGENFSKGQELSDGLVEKGTDWLWPELEKLYEEVL